MKATLKPFYLIGGLLSMALGLIGIALSLLPTIPFFILAAFCFARSSPSLENKLLSHPGFGPSIRLWRERGAISREGKRAATIAFATSVGLSFLITPWPWPLLPVLAALTAGIWIWRRPEA